IAGLIGGGFGFFFVLLVGEEYLGRNFMTPFALFWCCALPVAPAALLAPKADRSKVAIWLSIITVALWSAALRYPSPLHYNYDDVRWWPQTMADVGLVALVFSFSPARRVYQIGVTGVFLALLAGALFDLPCWPERLPDELETAARESSV